LSPGFIGVLLAPGTRVGLMAIAAGAGLITVLRAVRRGDLLGAVEPVVLLAVVLITPPLVAFGLYFSLWHAARHLGRLNELDPVSAQTTGKKTTVAGLSRVLVLAAPTTALAAGGVAVLWLILPDSALPSVALAGLLAVTAPHALIVARMPWRGTSAPAPGAPKRSLTTPPSAAVRRQRTGEQAA
jgi:Brp/Blh family beta-carotene 15,15'-monooxygenase